MSSGFYTLNWREYKSVQGLRLSRFLITYLRNVQILLSVKQDR